MNKKVKRYIRNTILLTIFLVAGCKKEAGVEGKKLLNGIVTYTNGATGNNDPAPGALVHIAYGTTSQTGNYNQTVLTDGNGKYSIPGLRTGDYFITAEFTDTHGFRYTVPGYGVTINNKKTDLYLDIHLK